MRKSDAAETVAQLTLARCDKQEKDQRLAALRAFQARHAAAAPEALAHLQKVAIDGGNLFAELMSTVHSCSLGQITRALYEVGGQYRRAM
jgi:methylmalonyl-CoA mutase